MNPAETRPIDYRILALDILEAVASSPKEDTGTDYLEDTIGATDGEMPRMVTELVREGWLTGERITDFQTPDDYFDLRITSSGRRAAEALKTPAAVRALAKAPWGAVMAFVLSAVPK